MTCKMCQDRNQDWEGEAPKCGWVDDIEANTFSRGNWNCATLNALRTLCQPDRTVTNIDSHYCCDDNRFAVIDISDLDEVDGLALWVEWYKDRGNTSDIRILGTSPQARHPTEREILAILYRYIEYGRLMT